MTFFEGKESEKARKPKTKEQLLKEFEKLKSEKINSKENINCSDCFYCSNCSDCFNCSNCSDCSYCYYCSNLANAILCIELNFKRKDYDKYWLLNKEVSKEEYDEAKEVLKQK